jgi:hypothetical protein
MRLTRDRICPPVRRQKECAQFTSLFDLQAPNQLNYVLWIQDIIRITGSQDVVHIRGIDMYAQLTFFTVCSPSHVRSG